MGGKTRGLGGRAWAGMCTGGCESGAMRGANAGRATLDWRSWARRRG